MAEIALALAIAPLVISAAEHYSTAAKCIKRYRSYESKHEELVSKIKVQKRIFHQTIWRLLAYDVALGEDEASQMLIDVHHPGWQDAQTQDYFAQRMAEVSDELKDSIRMIHSQLAALDFNLAADSQTTYTAPTQGRSCAQSTTHGEGVPHPSRRKKIQFAVSEGKLREAVENVRTLTKDFRTLVEQTAPPQERAAISKPSSSTRGRVAGYAAVKTAATDLYQALGLACTKHTSHQAHLSLKPTHGDSSQIKFTIAFRQTIPLTESRKSCNDTRSTMWLTVESQLNGTIQTTDSSKLLTEMRPTMKRPADTKTVPPLIAKPKKLAKKSVKFHLAAERSSEVPLQVMSPNMPNAVTPTMQNLCTQSNFCNQLQNFLGQPLSGSQTCIGYLECSGKSKHLVYMNSKEHSISPISPSLQLRSLREVYRLTKQGRSSTSVIPLHHRISLAKELATAVLQFHATPWLLNSICSNDVLLPGTSGMTSTGAKALHEPYVDVSIRGPHGPPIRQTTFPSRTLIRNRLLFSLGVMLLELAYQAPLHSLQKPADVDVHVEPNTDYHTADRVRHEAASILGPRYAEVVRKCIQCDFGRGDDLGETRLQEGFHQDVICELEELEERFRNL